MENSKTNAVSDYVAEIAKLAKTGKATEHSYRGALTALLQSLAPGLQAVNEPTREKCGAPDFIVQDKTGLPVFYAETKQLGDGDLDGKKRTAHKEQFDRYKGALDTIVFTDYLDFHLYRHGNLAGTVCIADLADGKVSGRKESYADLVALIGEAAAADPRKIDSAKKLAQLMAAKARIIQRVAETYLTPLAQEWEKEHPQGSTCSATPTAPLLSMMLDFRSVLMPEVGVAVFSDIFAQTLTYGMFAARLNDPSPDNFTRDEAMRLIPKSNPFLKQVFTYIATNLEDQLEWAVDDLADLFAHADVAHIMRDYGKAAGMSDPMVHFYEDFLREYDAGLRKDRGVWYTPIHVVRFIVGAADWALRKFFGLADGLADASKTEIEVREATTHGRKLERKVKKIVHKVQVLDPAMGTGTFHAEVVRNVRTRFDGNEGLWPSYVEQDLLPRLNGFELMMASYTMAHVKLDYVLRETGAMPTGKERFRLFLTDSLSDWHKELPGGLFAAALGAEQEGADEVKRDIPVMVVMGNPPYSGEGQNKGEWIMRKMEDYKVEPGGKVRLQERNPKWINDDYVKFIRLAEHYVEKNGSGIVAYITPHGFLDNPTFRGMRWHLMQTFDEIYTLNLHGNAKKKEVAPDGGKDECVFNIMQGVAITLMVKKPKSPDGRTKFDHRCCVFYSDLWGTRKVKLAALDAATMDSIKWQELKPTEPMLFFVPRDTRAESEWIAGFGIADMMAVNGMGVTTGDDVTLIGDDKNGILSKVAEKYGSATPGKVKRIAYRPFDARLVYYDANLLARAREKFMQKLTDSGLALCLIRINSKDNGCAALATVGITDKTILSSKDNANVFPLYLYEENMGTVEKRSNLDKAIVAKIAAAIGGTIPTPESIFHYIYGVLHSPVYRSKFKEFLKSDFPRIPYPKSRSEFEAFEKIGKTLVEAHLLRDAAPGLSETRARFPKAGTNEVEKVERDYEGRVWINGDQYFSNVPERAWAMPIGGYLPAQKWLKDRKGRVLTLDDRKHYQRIILALEKTANAIDELAAIG